MKPPAFQFYPDDFIGGTCDLSTEEVGAYIRLLCYQWSRGSIPVDPAKLARIAGSNVTPDTLQKFPGGMNARLEFERTKQADFREERAKSGKMGAVKRWQNHSSAIAEPSHSDSTAIVLPMANTMANDSSPSPSPLPNTKPQKSPAAQEGFDEFWQAYPRKEGKEPALKSWTRDNPDLQTVLNALAWQKKSQGWTKDAGQFIPLPASYLNAKRYNDEKPASPAPQFPRGQSRCV